MILPCVCRSEFQDERYGKGMRVHNPTDNGARCTVCQMERSTKVAAPVVKKAEDADATPKTQKKADRTGRKGKK